MSGIESGHGTDWETESGDEVGVGGVIEGQDAGVQAGTEMPTWTAVWEELAVTVGG